MQYQPKLGKPRENVSARVKHEIRKAVKREAAHFNVSYSFVINVAIAEALHIPLEGTETYKPKPHRLRLVQGERRRKLG
jgi:uncharacterized protein (DUF1778 family)